MRLKTSLASGNLSRSVTFLQSTSRTPRSPPPPTAPFGVRFSPPSSHRPSKWSGFSKSQTSKKSL